MPVRMLVTYEDGGTELISRPVEIWFQSNRVVIQLPELRAVAEVTLDPEHVLPDTERKNNVWNVEKKRAEKKAAR